jgi:hypothetical protein
MRFGFFIGFLIGAAIASLISMSADEDADDLPSDSTNPLDQIKRQAREARLAGQKAAAEKEAELLRDWEEARHRDT